MTATEPSVADPQRLFVEHLEVIDRILAIIARRNGLDREDAGEFGSFARSRLTDGNYAILRKFGGRSSLTTYLTVVLQNLFRDFRNSQWGRWRPSAGAKRLGPDAILLEQLVRRDGCPVREAISILRSRGIQRSDAELMRIAAQFPPRSEQPDLDIETIDPPAPPSAAALDQMDRESVTAALRTALAGLNDEDRLILRLHYWDDASIADISRMLRIEQKPLYRKLESIQKRIREQMTRAGITEERARDVLAEAWI